MNQGRDKTAFITVDVISQEQDKPLSREWFDQEVVFLPVDLQDIDALSLIESDEAIFQTIAEHVKAEN